MQEINFQRKVTTNGHPIAEMPKKLNIKKKKSGVSKTKNKSGMSPQIILIPKLALKKTKGASIMAVTDHAGLSSDPSSKRHVTAQLNKDIIDEEVENLSSISETISF